MTTSSNLFYSACKDGDVVKVREFLNTLNKDQLNQLGPNKSTPLHAAAFYGHIDVLKLLLAREDIDRTIKNEWNCLAYDEAPDRLKFLFELSADVTIDSSDTTNRFVDYGEQIEWFDTYTNAYRIAFENQDYIKRWLTKISFARLVQEIITGYLDTLDFGPDCDDQKIRIRNHMKNAIKDNDPTPVVRAYTEHTRFYSKLNEDLATLGSDFRFECSYAMSITGYHDNEPPKGLGQYIIAAILIHHPKLDDYRTYTGVIYRGMNVKKLDLDKYEKDKSVMTRSFLSSSTDRLEAEKYLNAQRFGPSSDRRIIRLKVILIYKIRNRNTALALHTISAFPDEKEILIVPFTAFKITNIKLDPENISEIELDECGINANR